MITRYRTYSNIVVSEGCLNFWKHTFPPFILKAVSDFVRSKDEVAFRNACDDIRLTRLQISRDEKDRLGVELTNAELATQLRKLKTCKPSTSDRQRRASRYQKFTMQMPLPPPDFRPIEFARVQAVIADIRDHFRHLDMQLSVSLDGCLFLFRGCPVPTEWNWSVARLWFGERQYTMWRWCNIR